PAPPSCPTERGGSRRGRPALAGPSAGDSHRPPRRRHHVVAVTPSTPPAWQDAIRARRVHPSAGLTSFPAHAVEQSIPSRFVEQVAAHPDRLAVKDGARTLTYAEIDRAANAVAMELLRALGEEPEPVPLLLPHSADAIVACLGVLKAGKFYAP